MINKETEFEDLVINNRPADVTKPRQSTNDKLPFSSVGINLGVTISFGKTKVNTSTK